MTTVDDEGERREGGRLPAPGTGGGPAERQAGLAELVSRVVERGVVISGDLIVSVAGVDLVYVGLDVVLSSVETLERGRELSDGTGGGDEE